MAQTEHQQRQQRLRRQAAQQGKQGQQQQGSAAQSEERSGTEREGDAGLVQPAWTFFKVDHLKNKAVGERYKYVTVRSVLWARENRGPALCPHVCTCESVRVSE